MKSLAKNRPLIRRWSTGNTKKIVRGDRLFFLQQRTDRGIFGTAYADTDCFEDEHWEDSDKTANYVRCRMEAMVQLSDRLPIEDLMELPLAIKWNSIYASGLPISSDDEPIIEQRWRDHLLELNGEPPSVIETDEIASPRRFREGAVRQCWVNSYERNASARKQCLHHHGVLCSVCGFDFEKVYGDLGHDYTHVHHLVELSSIGEEYEIDPISDLRPVCPNCHAMLHRQSPALSIDELRSIVTREV